MGPALKVLRVVVITAPDGTIVYANPAPAAAGGGGA